MLKPVDDYAFSLDSFEGPLDLLLYLIQKKEVDIYEVPLLSITKQYLSYLEELTHLSVDAGAEFLGTTALLMYIKSQTLLPKKEAHEGTEELDPRYELLQQLLEYHQVRDLAKNLSEKEDVQASYFSRGVTPLTEKPEPPIGIDHLSLEDLSHFFNEVMMRAESRKGSPIQGEKWSVRGKMEWITRLLASDQKVCAAQVFSASFYREELIVTFLAVLELMKLGNLYAIRDPATSAYYFYKHEECAQVSHEGN